MSTPLLVECNNCGREWMGWPQHLLRGSGCRECSLLHRDCSNNKPKTTTAFVSEMEQVHPNIVVVGQYHNAHTPITCRCKTCGHVWNAQPANLLMGCGCPDCGRVSAHDKQAQTTAGFISRLRVANPSVEIIGEYKNNRTAVACRCRECGDTWSALPLNLLRGTACPKHRLSHGEKAIMRWLKSHNVEFECQKRFDELVGVGGRRLPFDFYLPRTRTLIEFQGNFHDRTDRLQSDENYDVLRAHDEKKREFANKTGFQLIEIWYYDDIEEKLEEVFGITDPVTTTAI